MTRAHGVLRGELALLVSAALLACGAPSPAPDASSPPDAAPADAGSDAGRDGGVTSDAGPDAAAAIDGNTHDAASGDAAAVDSSTSSDASDAGPTSDAGVPHAGVLQVSQYMLATGPSATSFTALFGDFTVAAFEQGDLPGCTRMVSGQCIAISCGGSPPPVVSAGAITVTVATAAPVLVSPSGSGTYSSSSLAALSTGATVTTSAAGAVVPAFTLSAAVPARPVATLPSSIAMSAPLTITWNASVAAAQVSFGLTPSTGSGRAIVTCIAPAADGTLTVSPTVLTALGAGGALAAIAGIDQASSSAGPYALELRAIVGSAASVTVIP